MLVGEVGLLAQILGQVKEIDLGRFDLPGVRVIAITRFLHEQFPVALANPFDLAPRGIVNKLITG